jgi:hypothetical protein
MNETEIKQLKAIREHLADLHEKWQNDPECDGYCKSNEGYIGITAVYPNWFEAESNKEKYLSAKPTYAIEVYSYLFGPNRLHQFPSIHDAYEAIMDW